MDPVTQYILGWNTPALICLIAGLVFMTVEMFTPGLGVPAILGSLSLLAAVVLRADSLTSALVTLVLIVIPLLVAGAIVMRSLSKGALNRSQVVLKDSIDGSSSSLADAETQALVGAEGVALTALRPAGVGSFDGKRLDVVSGGGFITKDAPIRITAVEGLKIMVEQL